jgi:hypothetical protein
MVQENKQDLEMNGIYNLRVYSDDINLFSENVRIIKKNIEALSDVT